MADKAHRLTDDKIDEIEKYIESKYRKLKSNISGIMLEYAENIESQADELLVDVKTALTDKKRMAAKNAYTEFIRTEIIGSADFAVIMDNVVDEIYEINAEVTQYINSQNPEIYALNYNYINSGLAKDIKGFPNMQVTVEEVERYGELDRQNISKAKDGKWNESNIKKSIVVGGGLLLGVKAIMCRTAGITAKKNQNSANLHNRDMATYAENIARLDGMFRARDMGFDIQKQWRATLDNRTRDSHARLDGTTIELEELFPNGIMYPRDPTGTPDEIMNCRCHLRYVMQKYTQQTTRTAREGTVTGRVGLASSWTGTRTVEIPNMNYREWMKWKGGRNGSRSKR